MAAISSLAPQTLVAFKRLGFKQKRMSLCSLVVVIKVMLYIVENSSSKEYSNGYVSLLVQLELQLLHNVNVNITI